MLAGYRYDQPGVLVILLPLLPLRALEVTLEFTAPAEFSFFHQAAVHAFTRTLTGSQPDYDAFILLDAPETGRVQYIKGDHYCYALYLLPGGEALLQQLITQLKSLPNSSKVTDRAAPLRDNVRLYQLKDLFTDRLVKDFGELSLYDNEKLNAETDIWRHAPQVTLCWLSPARLLKGKRERIGVKGEQRFCRQNPDITGDLMLQRLYDTLAEQLRRRKEEVPPRPPSPRFTIHNTHLFWLDSEYRSADKNAQPIGGMMGEINLGAGPDLPVAYWRQLVLGQYLGVGQRRSFGLGRYRLEALEGSATLALSGAAKTLAWHAVKANNLYEAYDAIRDNLDSDRRRDKPPLESVEEEWWLARYPDPPDPDEQEAFAARLERIGQKIAANEFQPAALKGVVIREKDGDLRGLAIPPFWDRVAQRAITQLIAPALENLMYSRSHGYRKGRSRQTASFDIQRAYRQGYRWVYEADIEDFFDNISWDHLHIRLKALYRDDPVINLLMAWVAAPVDYQGFRIDRHQGLPQGSPVSPVMANLILDDFDTDLQSAGFRLVRYADDFVVLCKNRERLKQAAKAVQRSLAELGLELNEKKSGAVSFEQGFKYLGYLFMNDLVIDIGGKGEKAAVKNPPPPGSWMAKLSKKLPVVIEDFGKPPPKTAASKPDENAATALGERKDGTLLIITGRSALITTKEGRLIASRDDEPIADMAINGISTVLLLGKHHITTPAIRVALKNNVPIHLATGGGRYQGTIWNGQPGADGAALWQRQQEVFANPALGIRPAQQVVMARIRHMRETLRQRSATGFYEQRRILAESMKKAGKATDIASLNGAEGNATRVYYQALAKLVPEEYGFNGRNRRPPRDPFNALLSLGYTIVYAHVETLIRVDGLYPWTGFYHQPHGRHAALASDLMEPFRHVVERVALTLLIRHSLKPEDFTLDPQKGCRLTPAALRTYLKQLHERLDMPLQAVGEAIPMTPLQHMHRQNLRLVDWLRGGSEFKAWVVR